MSVEKNIYTHLHLHGNELREFVFERLESDPDPIDGRIYYNVAKNELRACISGVWVNMFSIWHIDDDGNITTDKQVIIKNNLLVEGDTASSGTGEDTPVGGISGVKVNGVTYYDDNGDGIVDLGTISGGGGVSGDYLPLSGGTITGDLSLNQYLRINAWEGYGSGSANIWYDGTLQQLKCGDVANISLKNGEVVVHSGNIGGYAFEPKTQIISNTDADTLLTNGVYLNATGNGSGNSHFPSTYSTFLTFAQSSNYAAQISIGNNALYMRRKIDSWSHWMRIIAENENGNVLIGTEVDSGYKLDVNGSISSMSALRIGGCGTSYCGLYPNNQITSSGDSSKLWLYNNSGLVLYGTSLEIYPTTILYDKLGIGISSPTCALDVVGDSRIRGALNADGSISISSDSWREFSITRTGWGVSSMGGIDSDGAFFAHTLNGVTSYMYLKAGRGLTIHDNLIVSGDVASGSDIRFKDIIEDKTIKIEHIAKAPLFTFKWNNRDDEAIHLGSSAQYWENITPWLVKGEDFKTLDYSTLGVAMGISLAKKVKELEAEIKRLKEAA